MRILHVTDNARSPYRAAYDVLIARGFAIEAIALQELHGPGHGWRRKIARYLPNRKISKLIADKVAAFNPDIIQIGTGRTAALAVLRALPAKNAPPLLIERGAINGLNVLSPFDWQVFFSPRIDAVIMPSHAMFNNWTGKPLLSRLIQPERCDVIHHPIPAVPPCSAAQRKALRQELGFADDEFVIGTVCKIRPIKNLDFAAGTVAGLGQGFVMAVIGPADTARMARLKATGGISLRLLGPITDARNKMAAFDLYITPTRAPGESFGIAAAEAMAAGLPVLTMQVGGTAEIVEHGISGFTLPPIASHWAAAIKQLAQDRGLVKKMGEAARHRIETVFSPEAIADQFESLYRRRAKNPSEAGRSH